jgi:hypothetical protein
MPPSSPSRKPVKPPPAYEADIAQTSSRTVLDVDESLFFTVAATLSEVSMVSDGVPTIERFVAEAVKPMSNDAVATIHLSNEFIRHPIGRLWALSF